MSSTRPTPPTPFPDVRSAFLLTIGAIFAGGLIGVLFIDLGFVAAEGIGTALGIGGVATLAARRVAEPQAVRIGLTPLDWRALPLILCLVPAVLLASELDNFAYDWSPESEKSAEATVDEKEKPTAPAKTETVAADAVGIEDADTARDAAPTDAERPPSAPAPDARPAPAKDDGAERAEPLVDPDNPFSVMEGLIVAVGIAPVVHEFLFRGVLQQGLVAQLGVSRGVTLAALLWTMLRPVPSTSPARFAAAFVGWFAMGWLLGMVRLATRSILGSILLASLWAAVGFTSMALEGRVELSGMNVSGTHLPVGVTVASLLVVGWAGRKVFALGGGARRA